MAKLTSQRVNGIRSGYWSTAKKEELVQRLEICDKCPMNHLLRMMGME